MTTKSTFLLILRRSCVVGAIVEPPSCLDQPVPTRSR